MDLQTLVAAHMPNHRPTHMSASAEDRYYRNQLTLPHLRPRLLRLIATTAGMTLLLAAVINP